MPWAVLHLITYLRPSSPTCVGPCLGLDRTRDCGHCRYGADATQIGEWLRPTPWLVLYPT